MKTVTQEEFYKAIARYEKSGNLLYSGIVGKWDKEFGYTTKYYKADGVTLFGVRTSGDCHGSGKNETYKLVS